MPPSAKPGPLPRRRRIPLTSSPIFCGTSNRPASRPGVTDWQRGGSSLPEEAVLRNNVHRGHLNRPSAYPLELSPLLKGQFDVLYRPGVLYRATGVVLLDLSPMPRSSIPSSKTPSGRRGYVPSTRPSTASTGNTASTPPTWGLPTPSRSWARGSGARRRPGSRSVSTETGRRHLGVPILHPKEGV